MCRAEPGHYACLGEEPIASRIRLACVDRTTLRTSSLLVRPLYIGGEKSSKEYQHETKPTGARMYRYASQLLRRDVPTQMIVNRLIEHRSEYDYDDDGGDTSARKSRWKDKNKHQKEMLRRSWQHDLDAINRRGCAIEYALDEAKHDRRLRLTEEEEEGRLTGLAYDILAERFGKNCFIGHMLVASAVRTQNREYMNDVHNRYEDHLLIKIGEKQCSRREEEEADLDRAITRDLDKERMNYLTQTPQPSQNDDVAFCGPPKVTVNGKTVTVLQRDLKAQQRFGATLRAKRRQEAPLRYWEQIRERRPAKSSKYDEGDAD